MSFRAFQFILVFVGIYEASHKEDAEIDTTLQ